jgi:probable rRNA maturation factor
MPISVASPRSRARLLPPLRRIVRSALAVEGARPGEIAIVLSDDAQLRALNRRWRDIDRATDVLSFGYDENVPAPRGAARRPAVSGDLVISMQRLAAQAKRYRVTPGRELARLVVHGALHLAGLDHHRATERAHMRTQERKVMRGIGADVTALDRALKGAPRR